MSIATVTTLVSSLMASFLLSIHLGTIKMEIEWTDEPAKKSSQPFKHRDSHQPKDTGVRNKPYVVRAENGTRVTVYPEAYWHTKEGKKQKAREAEEMKEHARNHPANSRDKKVRDEYWEQVEKYGP
jgi:hypothetical protein